MRKLKFLTPKGIYDYYLNGAATRDREPPATLIGELQNRLGFERYCFEGTGAKAEDLPLYESNTKPLRDLIERAERAVYRNMITGAETGEWIAFGRVHPDAKPEIIPERYWPFLTLDIENNVATGSDKTYRAVFGLIARQIPKGHPILESIRVAQIRPDTIVAAAVEADAPVPPPQSKVARTGAPGRPSSMHLIQPEFERRARAGSLEESLSKEAQVLVAWLRANHPGMPALTSKTVYNNLLGAYRRAKPRE